MACMDHHCIACDWIWSDNNPRGDCPMCGNSLGNGHHFDEPRERGKEKPDYGSSDERFAAGDIS